jgi:hypothetical protein
MTTTTDTNGRIEMSLPRIAGVRSETVAIIQTNGRDGDWEMTKAIRHTDGELQVLPYRACRTYSSQARAIRAAQKWLSEIDYEAVAS